MKKLICILLAMFMIGSTCAFAEGTSAIASYKMAFTDKQGENGFYFCESKSGQIQELVWNTESNGNKRWISQSMAYPMVYNNFATPGSNSDIDYMFVSPMRGTVRLQGTVNRAPDYIGNSAFGDGVKLYIMKNSRVIWSGSIASDEASESYDITACLATGDKLHFVINCGQHNYFDATAWWPSVDYISTEYTKDEFDPLFYQKDSNGVKELEFSESADGYVADDGVAFISDNSVLATDKYSVLKRVKIGESGRYRVYAPVTSTNTTGFGNVVKVYRNDEEVWKQLLLPGRKSTLDIGLYAEKDDYIDVEMNVNGYGGFNKCTWTCDVTKYMGKLFKECDTSEGEAYTINREYTLSSFIKRAGTSNVGVYSQKYAKVPMIYNNSEKKWKSGVDGEKDYVSETMVGTGVTTDVIIDIKLPQDGIMKLDGNFALDAHSDGMVIKAYLNGKMLWSNRVGSEQSLRWDDKFDEVYFLNNINAISNVKAGDTLSFTFNKWRSDGGDNVNISDVKLMYIKGNVLSETTKWKLKNTTVVDTKAKTLYKNGANGGNVDINIKDGTTYIAKNDLEKVFGDKAEKIAANYANDTEVPLRKAAEIVGKNLFWAADRMIMLYDGISVFYSYPEECEIRTHIENGGNLYE